MSQAKINDPMLSSRANPCGLLPRMFAHIFITCAAVQLKVHSQKKCTKYTQSDRPPIGLTNQAPAIPARARAHASVPDVGDGRKTRRWCRLCFGGLNAAMRICISSDDTSLSIQVAMEIDTFFFSSNSAPSTHASCN